MISINLIVILAFRMFFDLQVQTSFNKIRHVCSNILLGMHRIFGRWKLSAENGIFGFRPKERNARKYELKIYVTLDHKTSLKGAVCSF